LTHEQKKALIKKIIQNKLHPSKQQENKKNAFRFVQKGIASNDSSVSTSTDSFFLKEPTMHCKGKPNVSLVCKEEVIA